MRAPDIGSFFFFKQESMGVLIYIKLVIYSIFYLILYLDFNKGTKKVSLQQNFKFMTVSFLALTP